MAAALRLAAGSRGAPRHRDGECARGRDAEVGEDPHVRSRGWRWGACTDADAHGHQGMATVAAQWAGALKP